MLLNQFLHSRDDAWIWRWAQPTDVITLAAMTYENSAAETADIFTNDIRHGAKNIHLAIVEQLYDATRQQILVAESAGAIIAWTWIRRGIFHEFSRDEAAHVVIMNFAETLPKITRVRVLAQAIQQWAGWCLIQQIPVLISNTFRAEQAGFLRIHQRAGFTVRGSVAMMRITELPSDE